jgi:hypothetical protein
MVGTKVDFHEVHANSVAYDLGCAARLLRLVHQIALKGSRTYGDSRVAHALAAVHFAALPTRINLVDAQSTASTVTNTGLSFLRTLVLKGVAETSA